MPDTSTDQTSVPSKPLRTSPDTKLTSTGNTDGLPFSSYNLTTIVLESDKFGKVQIFPLTQYHSGQNIYQSMSIEESLFSPIVKGYIILKDIGSLSDKLNLEGFEKINITFKVKSSTNKKESIENTFEGMITDFSIMTDDAINANRMNSAEINRIVKLNFMNKDIFLANLTLPVDVPKNDKGITDFVGWISKRKSLDKITSVDVDEAL